MIFRFSSFLFSATFGVNNHPIIEITVKNKLLFFLRLAVFWFIFFFVSRLLFLLYHGSQSFQLSFAQWLKIFTYGAWMDLSIMGYILLLSLLLGAILFFSGKLTKQVVGILTYLLLAVCLIIVVSDLELYRHWGYRIDAAPLFYLQTPAEAMASVKLGTFFLFLLFISLLFLKFFWLYRVWVHKARIETTKWWSAPVLLFVAATMIIPIRGGFGIAPMNPGKVFLSSIPYSNHASLNVVWNLMYSLSKSKTMFAKYPTYATEEAADEFYESLNVNSKEAPNVLNTPKPNVVIILLESFSSKTIEPLGGMSGVTPNFNALADKGLLFTNLYASGDRSDKGIVAILSSLPAQSTKSIIKHTLQASKLPSISNSLYENGYSTAFYYGGDPDFTNIRSYLYNMNFKNLVDQDDFPAQLRTTKWGIHDEHLFKRLLDDLDTAQTPYFKLFFTLSSHEPFDIPDEPAFPGTNEENKYLSSVHYTDKWLGWFFEEAMQRSWYKNTLFVLIADHGHRYPGGSEYFAPEKFAIPMLWLGGALDSVGVCSRIGGQIDVAQTLLHQLDIDADQFVFSRNLLADEPYPFAYYVFNDGFGFVTPQENLIWDHVAQHAIVQPSNDTVKRNAFAYFTWYRRYLFEL